MPSIEQARDQTAAALESLLLRSDRFVLSANDIRFDLERSRLHRDLLAEFIADARGDRNLRRDGCAAVIMAGPPGAGKGTYLQDRSDLTGYLTIDADAVKTRLLEHDVRSGRLDSLLSEVLPDNRPVRPEELAKLVHNESTMLASQMRQLALADGFNLIIEGTLQWSGQGGALTAELRLSGYEDLKIIAIEVPQDVAQRQALTRWWTGRVDPTSPGGGRFTPSSAISAMYAGADGPLSICIRRAIDTFNLDDVHALSRATLTIINRHGIGLPSQSFVQVLGEYVQGIPRIETIFGTSWSPTIN